VTPGAGAPGGPAGTGGPGGQAGTGEPRLVRFGVRVRAAQAEQALAALLQVFEGGAEERDLGGIVEYAIYAPPGELPPAEALGRLVGDGFLGTVTEPVADGWEERYREFLTPIRVEAGGHALTVRAPWLPGGDEDLVIDPGVVFGAGTHATTRLTLELLLESEPGGPLCDWGAGSGVVSIAAARLGWGPITAVDVDPRSLPVLEANAAANGVEIAASVADLRTGPLPWAPTIAANLTGPLHGQIGPRLERRPRRLLAAGMLTRYADDVTAAYAHLGLREVSRRTEGEWAAVALA
jgi:ribosomal protein L11 methyltransferase